MACRFAKVYEEEIEEAFFYPSDLVNTKTTTPLRVGEEWWIYLDTFCLGISPLLFTSPLQVVVYYAIKKNFLNARRCSNEILVLAIYLLHFRLRLDLILVNLVVLNSIVKKTAMW